MDIQNLRTDVAAYSFENQIIESSRAPVDCFRFRDIDAEFMFPEASGDVRVGGRVDIGVHAKGDTRLDSAPRSQRIDQGQFGLGLAVEASDVFLERVVQLRGGFS